MFRMRMYMHCCLLVLNVLTTSLFQKKFLTQKKIEEETKILIFAENHGITEGLPVENFDFVETVISKRIKEKIKDEGKSLFKIFIGKIRADRNIDILTLPEHLFLNYITDEMFLFKCYNLLKKIFKQTIKIDKHMRLEQIILRETSIIIYFKKFSELMKIFAKGGDDGNIVHYSIKVDQKKEKEIEIWLNEFIEEVFIHAIFLIFDGELLRVINGLKIDLDLASEKGKKDKKFDETDTSELRPLEVIKAGYQQKTKLSFLDSDKNSGILNSLISIQNEFRNHQNPRNLHDKQAFFNKISTMRRDLKINFNDNKKFPQKQKYFYQKWIFNINLIIKFIYYEESDNKGKNVLEVIGRPTFHHELVYNMNLQMDKIINCNINDVIMIDFGNILRDIIIKEILNLYINEVIKRNSYIELKELKKDVIIERVVFSALFLEDFINHILKYPISFIIYFSKYKQPAPEEIIKKYEALKKNILEGNISCFFSNLTEAKMFEELWCEINTLVAIILDEIVLKLKHGHKNEKIEFKLGDPEDKKRKHLSDGR